MRLLSNPVSVAQWTIFATSFDANDSAISLTLCLLLPVVKRVQDGVGRKYVA